MKNNFSKKTGGEQSWDEEASPMWGVSNMSDVMLVLAVGIMLALVANWRIDVSTGMQNNIEIDMNKAQELSEFEEHDAKEFIESINEAGIHEMGTVYMDDKSGKMYVITKEQTNE